MFKAALLDLNGVVEDLREFYWSRDDLIEEVLRPRFTADQIRSAALLVRSSYGHIMGHSVPEFHLMFWEDLLVRLGHAPAADELYATYDLFVNSYVMRSRVYPDAVCLL